VPALLPKTPFAPSATVRSGPLTTACCRPSWVLL
jgi:hypothetical protein